MADLLSLYWRLPYPLKSLAASARGYSLRRWRYNRTTENLVEEAFDRENWSAGQWQRWEGEQLARLLDRAVKEVPYYREIWSAKRKGGDRSSPELLENWPVLEKETLRRRARDFLSDRCSPQRMFREHTSGTTGTPITLWWSKETTAAWYALYEARARRWNGVSRNHRWGILGGQLVVPAAQQRPPFWVWNAGLNQLYLSAYHLSRENIPAYAGAIERCGVEYLLGYPSALHSLAVELNRRNEHIPLKVVITNAEPVTPYQRAAIETAFRCRVRETYGMAEIVCAASECSEGRLHLWPEVGRLEIEDAETGQIHPRARTGAFICTGYLNQDMPLIRYRVGDWGTLALDQECSCGRSLPALQTVEGRSDDLLITRDGRKIGRLDPVFKTDLPLVEAQIVQTGVDAVEVKIVPADGWGPDAAKILTEQLQNRLGDMRIAITPVSSIPRDSNGKFRCVVCRLPHRPEE